MIMMMLMMLMMMMQLLRKEKIAVRLPERVVTAADATPPESRSCLRPYQTSEKSRRACHPKNKEKKERRKKKKGKGEREEKEEEEEEEVMYRQKGRREGTHTRIKNT